MSGLRTRLLWVSLPIVMVSALLFYRSQALPERLRNAVTGQGKVWVVAEQRFDANGTEFLQLPATMRDATLDEWLARMKKDKVRGVLVAPLFAIEESGQATVLQRLQHFDSVPPLRAEVLSEKAAYYVIDERLSLQDDPITQSLGRIARQILAGSRPPRDSLFPEPFRRVQSVEVMVLISDKGEDRLWRSSRGSTIARALVTACTVARERWHERQQAMGGPLQELLPTLDVTVSLLLEDGTLVEPSEPFVERVFGPTHGVAYAHPAAWRYLLPKATQERGEGSAVKAYQALFRENAQPADSLRREDFRFYRLLVKEVARSKREKDKVERPLKPLPIHKVFQAPALMER